MTWAARRARAFAWLGCGLLLGCAPAHFRTSWDGQASKQGLVYGALVLDKGPVQLVSVYKMLHAMLGTKGLGDPGVFDDGSFVVTDLAPGSGYFVGAFHVKDGLTSSMLNEPTKEVRAPFAMKAGELHYAGSWEIVGYHKVFLLDLAKYTIRPAKHPTRVEILKTLLKDPTLKGKGWEKKLKAELAELR